MDRRADGRAGAETGRRVRLAALDADGQVRQLDPLALELGRLLDEVHRRPARAADDLQLAVHAIEPADENVFAAHDVHAGEAAEAANVNVGTTTSSPSRRPAANAAPCSAAVPEL